MTDKNNPHARRVTVQRTGAHKTAPSDTDISGRKVVAVRLKGDREQPRPVDVLAEAAQTTPPAETAADA